MTFSRGELADYRGERGRVTRTSTLSPQGGGGTRIQLVRNVWWRPLDGGTETMFSLRGDGVWRAFPGPADGPGLTPGWKHGKL